MMNPSQVVQGVISRHLFENLELRIKTQDTRYKTQDSRRKIQDWVILNIEGYWK